MRVLLDTVTVSELRKADRMDRGVYGLYRAGRRRPAHLSVITMNEIRYRIRKLVNSWDFAE